MTCNDNHCGVLHIVGNRPQFIKLAPVSDALRRRSLPEIIVHTGQHYDENMSSIFFEQLSIPSPNINLGVGSGSHAEMTAKTMVLLEKALSEFKPKCVLLYGDTNSTLAGALAAAKLCFPIAHVEAGPRIFDKKNPEEVNRVVADHLSTFLFCPDMVAVQNLKNEGITKGVFFTGDVMYDAFLKHTSRREVGNALLEKYSLQKNDFIIMTLHRQENTDTKEKLESILRFLEHIDSKIFFPVHPRTKAAFQRYSLNQYLDKLNNLILIEPLGYIEMINLLINAKMVLTDSGGLSKEASFARIKTLFLLELVDWHELVETGWIMPMDMSTDDADAKAYDFVASWNDKPKTEPNYFGDGHAAKKIADVLYEYCET